AAGDDLDQLHAVGGVEEVHTHQRAAQALADLGDGQGRGVGSKDALGLADLVQLGKGGLLDLHVLKGGLHDQVAVRAQVLFDAGDDLDQLHAVGGVEEVHTHQRAAQALADLGDGQGRGVGSKDALGLADLVQLGKGGLLDLHVLKGGLHDQVAVRAQVLFDA